MSPSVYIAVISLTSLSILTALIGVFLAICFKKSIKGINIGIGFSVGIMLLISLAELIPESITDAGLSKTIFAVFLGALVAVLFYSIVGGRAFCSWVCPVNIVTDSTNYLRRKLGFNEIQKRQPASRNMRYWVIVMSLVISFIFGVTAFEFVSPVSMVHRGIIFGLGFGLTRVI